MRIGKTVIYDGQELPEWVIVRNTPLQLGAPIEWTYMDVPGRPGAIPIRRKTGIRPIPIDITIDASNQTELKQRAETLLGMLVKKEEKPLQISDEPNRTYYALLDELTDFSKIANHGEGRLLFKSAKQPYKEGPAVSEVFNETTTFNNPGTAEAWPVITANFSNATTNYELTNQDGKSLKVIFEFAAGDELIIDTKSGKVTINGQLNKQALHLYSRWFPLEPGENTLNVETSNLSTTNPDTGEVTYHVETTINFNEMYY